MELSNKAAQTEIAGDQGAAPTVALKIVEPGDPGARRRRVTDDFPLPWRGPPVCARCAWPTARNEVHKRAIARQELRKSSSASLPRQPAAVKIANVS